MANALECMKVSVSGSLVAALLALSAPGAALAQQAKSAEKPAEKICFYSRDINGWSRIDDNTVRIDAGANRSFDLTLFSPAHDLAFRDAIGLKSGPSDWICTGNGLGVNVVIGGPVPQNLPVTNIAPAPSRNERQKLLKEEKRAAAEGLRDSGPGARLAQAYVEDQSNFN